MASTVFIDNQTIIYASWLNDVNAATYNGTLSGGVINSTTGSLALETNGVSALNIDSSQVVTLVQQLKFSDGTSQSTASYAGANGSLYENNQTITASYSITTGRNAMSVGPISVASGQSVTVPSGSRWVVL